MLVAITMRYGIRNDNREIYYILKEYKDIFDELGITLVPVVSLKSIDKIADLCDAVIITGSGNNIDENVNNYHDKLDYLLIKVFYSKCKKIIGICRGMQILNLFFGGSLSGKIDNHGLEDDERHEIFIDKTSKLYSCYNKNNLFVNSMHNYSIDKKANNFKVSAISKDGIIEAIEDNNIIGVQWHPELMKDIEFFKCMLFK